MTTDDTDERDTDLDIDEDVSGEGGDAKPWDPKKIRIDTKNFTLREIFTQIKEGELDLAPDFQRAFVWKERQRTRLVESILLGIPLPAFYFNQEENGTFQVVDGVQRLFTIKLFMENVHNLVGSHLEYLKGELDGKTYQTLDAGRQRRFAKTQIVVHVIEPQTPDELKYDIFSRVNTLGSPLSAQEIRHAMSKNNSRLLLDELTKLDLFDKATDKLFWNKDPEGNIVRDNRRMMDRELVLRFCAFRLSALDNYRHFESLDSFLLDFTRRIDGRQGRIDSPISAADLARLKTDFSLAMQNSHEVLGKAAFRRWPLGQVRRGPINRALFEAQSLALANHVPDKLLQHKERIAEAFRGLFGQGEYLNSVTVGTGDFEKVKYRLDRTHEALLEVIK